MKLGEHEKYFPTKIFEEFPEEPNLLTSF